MRIIAIAIIATVLLGGCGSHRAMATETPEDKPMTYDTPTPAECTLAPMQMLTEPVMPSPTSIPDVAPADDEYKQLLEYIAGVKFDEVILVRWGMVSFYLGAIGNEWFLLEYSFG